MKKITHEKLKIYRKYKGDPDMFVRTGRNSEQKLFNNDEWALIEDFLQSITLIKNGLASEEFKIKAFNRLSEAADEQSVKILMADG